MMGAPLTNLFVVYIVDARRKTGGSSRVARTAVENIEASPSRYFMNGLFLS
jgi:hypothetical protein